MLAGRNPTDRKLSTADSDGALFVLEHHLMGKGGPARHVHHAQDEWFYAVAGSFVFEVGDDRFQLDAGDFVFAPRRVPHVWACVSDAPGTILIGVQPALTFERFIERLGELKTLPAPAELGALFTEHGMAVVGPPLEVP
jgi:mannose-6-phosphate isomerase-like protein (cupin superfamily)